jgi:hypothetical protein
MRYALAPGALALLLALSGPVPAKQIGPDIRFVVAQEAEVRALASTSAESYVTNRLRRGQPVEVIQEVPGGWLKIRPPQGSFSWINTRFLEHITTRQPNYVVALEGVEVPVYIGTSEIRDKRPWIIGTRLKRGTQVTSRGATLSDQDGTWMPIEPPATEGRYIRAEAVNRNSPPPAPATQTTSAAAPAGVARSAFTPASGLPASRAPSANPPPTPEELWQRAQHAERLGQTAEAIRLYALLAAETARTNPTRSAEALARANYLQNGYTNYGAAVGTARPAAPPPEPPSSSVRLIGPPGSRPAEGVTTTTTIQREPPAPDRQLPQGWEWKTFRGHLRKAGRSVDDRVAYAVEIDHGPVRIPIAYVTASPGVSLEPYLNHEMEVTGYARWRGDIRANYMIATRATPVGR